MIIFFFTDIIPGPGGVKSSETAFAEQEDEGLHIHVDGQGELVEYDEEEEDDFLMLNLRKLLYVLENVEFKESWLNIKIRVNGT